MKDLPRLTKWIRIKDGGAPLCDHCGAEFVYLERDIWAASCVCSIESGAEPTDWKHETRRRLDALEHGMLRGNPAEWPILTQDLVLAVARWLLKENP